MAPIAFLNGGVTITLDDEREEGKRSLEVADHAAHDANFAVIQRKRVRPIGDA
jgi:hypothetical protein